MRWGDLQGPKYRELVFVQPTNVKYLALPEQGDITLKQSLFINAIISQKYSSQSFYLDYKVDTYA